MSDATARSIEQFRHPALTDSSSLSTLEWQQTHTFLRRVRRSQDILPLKSVAKFLSGCSTGPVLPMLPLLGKRQTSALPPEPGTGLHCSVRTSARATWADAAEGKAERYLELGCGNKAISVLCL